MNSRSFFIFVAVGLTDEWDRRSPYQVFRQQRGLAGIWDPICRRCRLSCGVHRQFRGGRVGAWRDESKSRPNSKHTDVPLNIGVISRKFSRTFCLLELHRHTEMPDLGRHIGIYELRQTPPGNNRIGKFTVCFSGIIKLSWQVPKAMNSQQVTVAKELCSALPRMVSARWSKLCLSMVMNSC